MRIWPKELPAVRAAREPSPPRLIPTDAARFCPRKLSEPVERRIGERQEGFVNREGALARRYTAHFARAATSDEVSDFTFVLTLGAAEA
jgi:hypothetical protein